MIVIMINGILVVNHFLKIDKFNELYHWIEKSAYELDIELSVLSNRELMFDSMNNKLKDKKVDFILFWDKDILLAKHLENLGYRVFNSAKSIEYCDDKALMHVMLAKEGIVCPRTFIPPFNFIDDVDPDDKEIKEYLDDIIKTLGYPFVIKGRKGSFGAQVHLIRNRIDMYNVLDKYKLNDIIFQEYIQSSHGRDMRLQVVGENVVASMFRFSDTDFRANVSNGGRMKSIEPSEEAKNMAIYATKALGLDFAGVDILFGENDKPILCEVNSNAHFINLYEATKINVADYIIKHIKESILNK